jgi:hypothetical protein
MTSEIQPYSIQAAPGQCAPQQVIITYGNVKKAYGRARLMELEYSVRESSWTTRILLIYLTPYQGVHHATLSRFPRSKAAFLAQRTVGHLSLQGRN